VFFFLSSGHAASLTTCGTSRLKRARPIVIMLGIIIIRSVRRGGKGNVVASEGSLGDGGLHLHNGR